MVACRLMMHGVKGVRLEGSRDFRSWARRLAAGALDDDGIAEGRGRRCFLRGGAARLARGTEGLVLITDGGVSVVFYER